MNKNSIYLGMIFIFPILLCAKAAIDQENLDKIKKSSSQEIYNVLSRYKITTFSTDKLIKDGLPAKELQEWKEVSAAANSFARQEDPKSSEDITKLENALGLN